ncbi:MAG: Mth938-like domain-containing protein [Candidatus Euphemobacter frigidus]|nr:Mth938-like domain-containing protein [Candidatus Euphemobacter frigidus]MDP8275306.1 Mth938-like domain-containing protein [Candidatus Euphemobacter frigidus]
MIEDYSFGQIVINGKTYTSDVIIFPDRIQSSWWRESGHSLSLKDIEAVLDLKPEVLVIGTGSGGLMEVPSQAADEIRNRGIELIVERTADAVETYNRLCKQRLTVGAFHLTC